MPIHRTYRQDEILRAAETTRRKYWASGAIPVDIDACISEDLSSIYVDLEYALDERMNFRVRFGLAHELGHVILHRRTFEEFRQKEIHSVLAWARHIRERFDTELLEREANEFAGAFLVPPENLQDQYDAIYPLVHKRFLEEGMDPESMDLETLCGYMANAIHKSFDVSSAVISIRLRKGNVRPSRPEN